MKEILLIPVAVVAYFTGAMNSSAEQQQPEAARQDSSATDQVVHQRRSGAPRRVPTNVATDVIEDRSQTNGGDLDLDVEPKGLDSESVEQPWDVPYELPRGVDERVQRMYDASATWLEANFQLIESSGRPYSPKGWKVRSEKLAIQSLIRQSRFLFLGEGTYRLPRHTEDTIYRGVDFGKFCAAFAIHRSEFPEMFMTPEELEEPIAAEFASRR